MDISRPSYTYPMEAPIAVKVPRALVSRLQKTRFIISESLKELEQVRGELFLLNDRLHRIDVVCQNALRRMLP